MCSSLCKKGEFGSGDGASRWLSAKRRHLACKGVQQASWPATGDRAARPGSSHPLERSDQLIQPIRNGLHVSLSGRVRHGQKQRIHVAGIESALADLLTQGEHRRIQRDGG
jgi:hypothetical protein